MSSKHDLRHEIKGWLFDVYPSPEGMVVWIITENDTRLKLIDVFHPSFYFNGPPTAVRAVFQSLSRESTPIAIKPAERQDFFTRESVRVMEVTLNDPTMLFGIVNNLFRMNCGANFYNCDINPAQLYFYKRDLFPLAICSVVYNDKGQILSIRALDSRWDLDYPCPPLRSIHLKLEGDLINPNHGWRGKLEILDDEENSHVLEADDPAELLSSLNNHLIRRDPDIVMTDWGDTYIIPHLRKIAEKGNIPLAFNRDSAMQIAGRRSRSYASYGRIVYSGGAQTFFGRWHIDRQNSFILNEAALQGLFEQARVTKIPIQHMARTSTGTGITSMQLETAYREGILIPWKEKAPEEFKTGLELLKIDKGGMVFLPPVGFHEEVAELDFASMYPSIMAKFNISPETVMCSCCPQNRVPETNFTVCAKRKGLVPKILEPLLLKRFKYKEKVNVTTDPHQREIYDFRQNALKWLLVVSFGYLGYKNCRFGRIEAHESVTAYSREKLLCTKEIAESHGYQLIHGIVDSVWVKKPGATEEDYGKLAEAISSGTGLPINLEGIYRWIVFPSSKTRPSVAVPNLYFGLFRSGKMKIRGLEIRRSDTPPFIREAQDRMLKILSQARNIEEYKTKIPDAVAILTEYRQRLSEGKMPLSDLVVSKSLSQDPRNYKKATLSAAVSQELLARGIKLDPGESIQYVITSAKDKDPASRARAYATITADHSYDVEKYTELLLKAGESLFSLFGYNLKKLKLLIGIR